MNNLTYPAKMYSKNNYIMIFMIDFFKGEGYCHSVYLDEVLKEPEVQPRGRHKKFSSVGNDLTKAVYAGRTYKTSRKINKIVMHCTATPIGRDVDAGDVDNMHINRWGASSGIGYHYLIKLDGTIEKGRWADFSGAHVKGHNRETLAVAYAGGVDRNMRAVEDLHTPAQKKSIEALLTLLRRKYKLNKTDVLGHREFPRVYKACPCLDMDKIRRDIG